MLAPTLTLSSLILLIFMSCGPLNTDARLTGNVVPEGDLGTLAIAVPDGFDTNPQRYTFRIFSGDQKIQLVEAVIPGQNYKLAAKDYCVKATSNRHQVMACGYQVKRGRELKVNYTATTLVWDRDAVAIDLGPKPWFEVSVASGQRVTFLGAANSFYNNVAHGTKYLLPSGQIRISYGGVRVLGTVAKDVDLPDLATKTVDVTPDDRRATIQVFAKAPRFGRPALDPGLIASSAVVAYSSGGEIPRVPAGFGKLSRSETVSGHQRFNWVKVPLFAQSDDLVFQLKAFPVAEGEGQYQIAVSGVSEGFKLVEGMEERFFLEPVNVAHINQNSPGYFQYLQIQPGDKVNLLGSERENQRPKEAFAASYLPTQSTIYLLRGNMYRVLSFLKDDAGAMVRQSVHELDYR